MPDATNAVLASGTHVTFHCMNGIHGGSGVVEGYDAREVCYLVRQDSNGILCLSAEVQAVVPPPQVVSGWHVNHYGDITATVAAPEPDGGFTAPPPFGPAFWDDEEFFADEKAALKQAYTNAQAALQDMPAAIRSLRHKLNTLTQPLYCLGQTVKVCSTGHDFTGYLGEVTAIISRVGCVTYIVGFDGNHERTFDEEELTNKF